MNSSSIKIDDNLELPLLLPPYLFKIGDILYVPGFHSDGKTHFWLLIGGGRNVMDMNSGYTLPDGYANRWLQCTKLIGVRIKCLHFIPESHDYEIPVVLNK